MKRTLILAGLFAFAASAHAGVNLNITNPSQVVAAPNTGFVLVTFAGTITLTGGFAPAFFSVESPSDGTNFLAFDSFDAGLVSYISAAVVNSNYSGNLFSFKVQSTDVPGLYDLNSGGFSPFAEAIMGGGRNGAIASDNEFFDITVTAVPEPASMAVLGLGAAALLRRRNKS